MTNFQNGTFGCFSHWQSCLCGTFCPCCLAARNRRTVQNYRNVYWSDVVCIANPYHTTHMVRQKYGYEQNHPRDCLCSCFCMCCESCRNYRELRDKDNGSNVYKGKWCSCNQDDVAQPVINSGASRDAGSSAY